MEIIKIKNKYKSKVYIEGKTIFKLDCQCQDFQFRRIKRVGEYADRKWFYVPCKHLRLLVETLINKGYKLKSPKEEGSLVCTTALRKRLIERSKGLCECSSSCQDKASEVHRMKRGVNGGLYSEANCKYLSSEHHRRIK